MSGAIADLEAFRDRHGLVQPRPGTTSMNGLMYTAEAVAILRARPNEAGSVHLRLDLMMSMLDCYVDGKWRRRPDGSGPPQSADDLGAVAYTSVNNARRVLKGLRWGFYFTAPRPMGKGLKAHARWLFQSWLGRFPALWAHVRMSALEAPTPLQYLAWLWEMGVTRPSDQDGWRKTYFYAEAMRQRAEMGLSLPPGARWALRKWMAGLSSTKWATTHSGLDPIGAVRRAYFGHEHPCATHSGPAHRRLAGWIARL